ncbi:MAG: hypothetical protein ACOC05_09625 [Oceanicaulis sp.]
MTALKLSSISALVLLLAACGETEGPDASPYAAGEDDAEAINAGETAEPAEGMDEDVTADAADRAETSAATPAADEDELTELEILAREICEAGDDSFGEALPAGAAFASRGADARVHAAWRLDGMAERAIMRTTALPDEARSAFDGAVADFLRHNMTAGFDRDGLTGAYRSRDGRFCVVHTEDAPVAALVEAVETARAQIEPAAE